MNLASMSMGIIKTITKHYSDYDDDECLDIMQIKNICNIYKINQSGNNINSVMLGDINFSSPEFKKASPKSKKKNQTDIRSDEFKKKHSFFIRILYACLKIEVELFDVEDNIVTLKNNYHLCRALEARKKTLIMDHLNILKTQYKNISQPINAEYEEYYKAYIMKIKIIDKIISSINKLIKSSVVEKTDNLLTLILPYFYVYPEFIEEYN